MALAFTDTVTSFADYRHFPFDSFVDETYLPSIPESNVVLFYISLYISAGNAASDQAFNQFKNRFIAANQFRDQAMEATVGVLVPGFIDVDASGLSGKVSFPNSTRMMTVKGTVPWWASGMWFYVLSLLNISIVQRYV